MKSARFLLSFLALATVVSAQDISRNPSVSLADEKLFLAFVEGGPDVVLNEYIRKNETLENWQVLFAVRYVRNAESVEEVVRRWKAYIDQVPSPGKKIKEDEGSSANDRRFMLAIRPAGDAYLETDQQRFVPGPNGRGVIYYQAAIRVNPKDQRDMDDLLRLYSDALMKHRQAIFHQTQETIDAMERAFIERDFVNQPFRPVGRFVG